MPPSNPRTLALAAGTVAFALAASAGAWLHGGQPWPADEKAREGWQRVDDIVRRLDIGAGSAVADLGAGGGFFTVRLARIVGSEGRVYAVDIDERTVRDLEERVAREGHTNVDVIRGDAGDPGLPVDALDAVLIVNAYHEMREHQSMLAAIRRALRPEGRLVLVEPTARGRESESRERQARSHVIAMALAEDDLRKAGFDVIERQEGFVDRPSQTDEWIVVGKRTLAP